MEIYTTTIEAQRAQNHERFEAYRRFEEMTDLAERLGYPIDHIITYDMRDGYAYCTTDTKDRPFHQQTAEAKARGRPNFTGSQTFEYTRLSHEHDEALMLDRFGRGELAGNVLIKYSKVPDAVVQGTTDISGYRRDLLRSFARIYYREGNTVRCRLFTLDHNHHAGTRSVGELFDITIDGRSSEDILSDHSLIDAPERELEMFVSDLVDAAKYRYDEAIFISTGQRTYAGAGLADRKEAMNVVNSQHLFVEQHMKAISAIMSLGLNEAASEQMLEIERQRTAAAIKLASLGYDISSNSDAGVMNEVQSGNYDRECATVTTGMNQSQTMENKWSQGECQVCFKQTSVGGCSICKACQDKNDAGVDLSKLRERNLKKMAIKQRIAEQKTIETKPKPMNKFSKEEIVKQSYGEYAFVRTELGIGGADKVVYDRRSDKVIGKL